MDEYQEKYDDLIKRGFTIEFHEEDRNYPMTGRYHAFCVSIKKNGEIIKERFSETSHEHALILAHGSMEITRDCQSRPRKGTTTEHQNYKYEELPENFQRELE
jgi:hypothetical protein